MNRERPFTSGLRLRRLQPDHLPIDSEPTIPVIVDCPGVLLRRIGPTLPHFKNENVELADKARIAAAALRLGALSTGYLFRGSSRIGRSSLIPSRATAICLDLR